MRLFPWFSPFETIHTTAWHVACDRSHAKKRLSLAPPAPHYLSCQKSKHIEEPKISERLSVFFVVELQKICQMYYDRVYLCEGQKWDLEREVRKRDYEVQEKWRAQRQRRTMRGEREQPSDRTSLLIISTLADPRVSDDIRAPSLPRSPSLSSRCFSAHSPFCIYVSLSICCSLFHDVFLGEHLRRERRFAPGRKPMEKVPTLETHMEESSTMTKFCHPADLCNLDQSCLDNLNDDLFVLFFCFF